jgi:hypothetical protein
MFIFYNVIILTTDCPYNVDVVFKLKDTNTVHLGFFGINFLFVNKHNFIIFQSTTFFQLSMVFQYKCIYYIKASYKIN